MMSVRPSGGPDRTGLDTGESSPRRGLYFAGSVEKGDHQKMMYASGVRMCFRILSCPSVRPPIWAGPDRSGPDSCSFLHLGGSLFHFRIMS